jgi:hypothetical protein
MHFAKLVFVSRFPFGALLRNKVSHVAEWPGFELETSLESEMVLLLKLGGLVAERSNDAFDEVVMAAFVDAVCTSTISTLALLGELVRKVSVDNDKGTYDGGAIRDKKISEETCFLSMTRRRLVCRTSITKKVES